MLVQTASLLACFVPGNALISGDPVSGTTPGEEKRFRGRWEYYWAKLSAQLVDL